jgi:hypothetical protein
VPASRPPKQIGIGLPVVLSARLDVLSEIASEVAGRTSRRELTGALIRAGRTQAELAEAIQRYRRAKVSDAFISGFDRALFRRRVRKTGPRPMQPALGADEDADLEIDPGDSLARSPKVRVGLALTRPLDYRLDEWVSQLARRGEKTTRTELLAALILAAPESGDELARLTRLLRVGLLPGRKPRGPSQGTSRKPRGPSRGTSRKPRGPVRPSDRKPSKRRRPG